MRSACHISLRYILTSAAKHLGSRAGHYTQVRQEAHVRLPNVMQCCSIIDMKFRKQVMPDTKRYIVFDSKGIELVDGATQWTAATIPFTAGTGIKPPVHALLNGNLIIVGGLGKVFIYHVTGRTATCVCVLDHYGALCNRFKWLPILTYFHRTRY